MKSVGYISPFVPPEWVAAHDLRPVRLELSPPAQRGALMGLCPLAQAVIESATRPRGMGVSPVRNPNMPQLRVAWQRGPFARGHVCAGSTNMAAANCAAAMPPSDAIVLVDSCDQLRRSAEMIESDPAAPPLFLLHLPRAWQSPGAEAFYQDELRRLGRFLVNLGGTAPSNGQLSAMMLRYQAARDQLRQSAHLMSAREFLLAMDELHTTGQFTPSTSPAPRAGIPLAVLGDCLLRQELAMLDLIESKGGRIAVNGTDAGIRGLPATLDLSAVRADPLTALAAGYHRTIPFISARPNSKLFQWLVSELPARGVRGIILLQRLWCDLWQAELPRLKDATGLPVLELEMQETPWPDARMVTRVEAFLEVLR